MTEDIASIRIFLNYGGVADFAGQQPGGHLMRVNLLNSDHVGLCWALTLAIVLWISSYAASGALSGRSPSQELRQREAAQARAGITISDGHLSVNLRQADLREVLGQIGEKAGFSVMMGSGVSETLSAQFTDMSLIEGLRRLLQLASLSYAIVYDANANPKGGLRELWVFSAGHGGPPAIPTIVTDLKEADTSAPKHSLQEVLARLQPQDDQPAEPATSPQPSSFLDAVNSRRREPPTSPQPSPFLGALNGQRSEPTAPPPPSPFLDAVNRQRPKAAEPLQHNPSLSPMPGQPQQ